MKKVLVALVLALTACSVQVQPRLVSSQEDGEIDSSISPFDNEHPAIRNMDPRLRDAMQQAARDAKATKGIDVKVTSGWRSKQYQQRLLDQGVRKYGSMEEARKFVNTPDQSTHVTGHAVDIGPTDAADWFSRKGSKHGLCQIYANEIWHYELATEPGGECPAQLSSSAAG